MPTMNINLTNKLATLIHQKVQSGLYNNASEVMRESLRIAYATDLEKPRDNTPHKDEIIQSLQNIKGELNEMGVSSISLFGSVLEGTTHPESDIDLFFERVADLEKFSLIDLVHVKLFLEETLNHKVDLLTKEGICKEIKQSVVNGSVKIF